MARIVVIDDSEPTRQFFMKALEEEHDISAVKNYAEAKQEADLADCDVIFLDCWLEDEEGLDVLEEIRQESDVPVVMISGYADKSIVSRAQDLGVSGFLQKPLEPEKIRNNVENALSGGEDDSAPEVQEIQFYGTFSVLIVDDDKSTLNLLSRPLNHYDIEFKTAKTSDEAWEIFQEFRPDVVVLDAKLEGTLSSIKLHERMKVEESQTFFIGITGYPESDEIDSLRQEDLVEIFYKPFSVERFVRTLAHLSFVIDRREKGEDVDEKKIEPEEDGIRERVKKTVVIGTVFIIIGLMLGFAIKWTQEWTTSVASEKTSIEKMYESIEGYLHRDEQRERKRK